MDMTDRLIDFRDRQVEPVVGDSGQVADGLRSLGILPHPRRRLCGHS